MEGWHLLVLLLISTTLTILEWMIMKWGSNIMENIQLSMCKVYTEENILLYDNFSI